MSDGQVDERSGSSGMNFKVGPFSKLARDDKVGQFSELESNGAETGVGDTRHEVGRLSKPASVKAESDVGDFAHILSASGIRKSYTIGGETRWVVDGVDFHAAAGECVFLSGPSGSGKSTLLSILGCLLESDSGEVSIAGRRVDVLSVAERTKVRRDLIGFVFQRFQLIRGLSAEDNVAVPLTLQGVSLADARERAGELLVRVGLELHCKQLPTAMSPGQCQRVALARALITSPKLLLADEPTAALDGKSGIETMELLKELVASTDSATVVVTHDPRILKYADRVCELENGRLK